MRVRIPTKCATLKVVERPAGATPKQVFFGATVTLVDADGSEQTHRIVGADEFDPYKD